MDPSMPPTPSLGMTAGVDPSALTSPHGRLTSESTVAPSGIVHVSESSESCDGLCEAAATSYLSGPADVTQPQPSGATASACIPVMSSFVNIPPPTAYSINYEIPPPKADFSAPPPYEVATKLPTYDEVQQEKSRQACMPPLPPLPHHGPEPRPAGLPMFLAIDADSHPDDSNNAMLGTDFMFFTAFIVSFLFNWIGFLLLMCFCHTIAARYGALSGFGLSLSKWTLIVKHSTEITDHVWLWWLIMSFGLLICIRAIIQYLNIKRGWRLLSGNPHAQERLLFFY